ncbi:MAG: hypothetical protein AAF802_14280, partial [Planctomycetota bacterium]
MSIHLLRRPAETSVRRLRGSMVYVGFILLALNTLGGCSRIRLPAVDPTGQRLFQPLPTTTSIALPGSAGEGRLGNCLQRLGDPLNLRPFSMPEPAFVEPLTPPDCLTPTPAVTPPIGSSVIGGASAEPCVPSEPCAGDCLNGPPAVLLGDECRLRDICSLPKRGKRGCILLSPQKIIAPVGGEVVLLSGICGTDGYLQVAEPLEWMLTPESVGTFIQVGDDDPGLAHRLARVRKANKQDPSFAYGVTSTKETLITRGNRNPDDDVKLEKGQTWITISSPSEGTSRVTVLAPESDCWDQRKATATIYWIDAARQFPGPQLVPAGTPVTLNTRVTRSEGTLPARGWRVVYELSNPELATFAGSGTSIVESVVDDAGNATVQLIPTPGTSGTTAVNMRVIRPGGERDNMPDLTLFEGQTFVTWSAPQLAIEAGAPEVASFGVPFRAFARVFNPGDQATRDVSVTLQVPERVQVNSPDTFATNLPGSVVWQIPEIPPQTQLDLVVDVTTEASLPLTFEARDGGGLFATDTVRVDVYRPSLVMTVMPQIERGQVGDPIGFDIEIRNTGDRPLENLQLTATGDGSMLHEQTQDRQVSKRKPDGVLQPGDSWRESVSFLPTDAGRRCIQVEATADAGQRTSTESCIIVVNRPVPTPAVTATLSGRAVIAVGDESIFRAVVANTGQLPLTNVRSAMTFDPQLVHVESTAEFRTDPPPREFLLEWVIPELAPGTSQVLEARLRAIGQNPRSTVVLAVESDQGARDGKQFEFQIVAGQPIPRATPAPLDPPPPTSPPPTIPERRPLPNPTQPAPRQPLPAAAEPTSLQVSLSGPAPNLPVFENEPIPYSLVIRNPSSNPDGNVSIRFNLPEGVSVDRVVQTLSPDLGRWDPRGGYIYLQDIGSMRPGEMIEYQL